MQIHVTLAGSDNALPQKLADAEIHFGDGPLKGLRLIGFSVEKGRKDGEVAVKLPARVYTVAGERRTVVGVLAEGFYFPPPGGGVGSLRASPRRDNRRAGTAP